MLHPHPEPKSFVISKDDVGLEAYRTSYVRAMEAEIIAYTKNIDRLMEERVAIAHMIPEKVWNVHSPHVERAVQVEIDRLNMLCATARSIIKSMILEMPESTTVAWYQTAAKWMLSTMPQPTASDCDNQAAKNRFVP